MKNFFIGLSIVVSVMATIGTVSKFEEKTIEDKYLQELHHINHSIVEKQSDAKLLSMSRFVCDILDDGQSADDAIFAVVFDQPKRNDATFIYGAIVVKASVDNFCPQYRFQTEAWAK